MARRLALPECSWAWRLGAATPVASVDIARRGGGGQGGSKRGTAPTSASLSEDDPAGNEPTPPPTTPAVRPMHTLCPFSEHHANKLSTRRSRSIPRLHPGLRPKFGGRWPSGRPTAITPGARRVQRRGHGGRARPPTRQLILGRANLLRVRAISRALSTICPQADSASTGRRRGLPRLRASCTSVGAIFRRTAILEFSTPRSTATPGPSSSDAARGQSLWPKSQYDKARSEDLNARAWVIRTTGRTGPGRAARARFCKAQGNRKDAVEELPARHQPRQRRRAHREGLATCRAEFIFCLTMDALDGSGTDHRTPPPVSRVLNNLTHDARWPDL